MPDTPQRRYTAPCPGCGAPVEFRSAQSTHAVCGYCHSTVVRSGEVLERVGKMAELFEDHSPLRLFATGTWEGVTFTLIGRLQYHGEEGGWTEWNAWLDDGSSATLGEDNGAYVFTRPLDLKGEPLPAPESLRLGAGVTLAGVAWSVTAKVTAHLSAAEGELPKLPALGAPFTIVELRSTDGQVLSIDYGGSPPRVDAGRSVRLEDLRLQGLKDESVKQETARRFDCPHCGAPVSVQLDTTQSCTCPACQSLIDLSAGIGAELQAVRQSVHSTPLIPLGSTGTLQGASWQVVGYQRREGREPGDDERFAWSEYLLYNRERGFAFLVDAEDGWSLVHTATGAPDISDDRERATYLGTTYRLQSTCEATTTEVLGEFYWPVERGQQTANHDYANGANLLSTERGNGEVTTSVGSRIAGQAVAEAFGLAGQKERFQRATVGPFVASNGAGVGMVILFFIVVVILITLMNNCSGSPGGYSRSTGGSYGGYSSGGSHK